jgi:hypothetical protein
VNTSADTGTRAPGPPKGVIPPSGGGPRSGFLSDVIVELGFAEREAVEQAVRAARSPGHTVARVLIESGAINEEQLAHATAERYGIAYVDLGSFSVDPSAANLIKPSAAKRYQAVPVGFVGGGLLVAMADPADALGVNDIAVMTKMDVKPAVASRPTLDALLDRLPLDDLVDADADGPPVSAADAGREYATAPTAPPAPESSAVFWQADARGVREAPPERAAEAAAEAAPGPGPDAGELARLTGELGDLRARLESTEVELDEARTRARKGKEASAELEEQRELGQEQREQLEEQRSGLAGMAARLEQAEAAAEEAEALRGQLGAVSAERDNARARAEALESSLADAARAEQELRKEVGPLTAERDDARARIEELEDADRRAEQARQALAELREDSEREREMLAMTERDLRASLGEEEKRRQELESRLSEVEGSAFAAERAFEELRGAQSRMRGALRALADPDGDDASGDDDA